MTREFSPSRVIAWLIACFLALPVLIMLPISVTPHRYLSLPDGDISFRHYASLVNDPRWLSSITDSLIVAVCATTLALLLGGAFAIGVWRRGGLTQSILQPIMLAPMIVPPIVHSVAFYKGWAAIGLLDSYIGLILVHAVKGTPFVILTVGAALVNIDPRTEQAARSLGASAGRSMRWVILPQIKSGLLAGGTFAFFISWDEIIVAMFITMRKVYTLPRRIWDGLDDNIDPAIAALGTVMILLTVIIMLYLAGKGDSKSSNN
ncbi:ABC transporter permease [Falsochrobactrum sp. TDYN1]|uniref:ABC transporter permease n=1 Tax=Falsochrobactrum tianjinense TaxID=2706015 RepID=A0A949PP00_9HYPH|nr:ABC transporter permease [Falsochrobactrum sp. TDYN1]MBV2143559.1 ABC transporter permease [Falsochrobactrum sp. TDYN1]